MNILMSANGDIFRGVEVVLYSTMLHNKNVHWYILTMDCDVHLGNNKWVHYAKIRKQDQEFAKFIVNYFDANSTIEFIDALDYYKQFIEGSVNDDTPFTPFTLLRLAADEIFLDLDSMLYLDCDVIVSANLEDDYNKYTTVDNDYSAYIEQDACYYQGEMIAGILFLNLKHIRESRCFAKARDYLKVNKYEFPDQSALAAANGNPVPIESSLNYIHSLEKICYTPKIVHFSAEIDVKIYGTTDAQFYRRYPQFKYIRDGLDVLINLYNMIPRDNLQ